jgi:thiol-disulfide isomerase/thioredoxin
VTPHIPHIDSQRRRTPALAALLLALALAPFATQASTTSTLEPTDAASDTFTSVINPLVGRPLADWGALRFIDSPAHRSRDDFRGKTLVIRFWTAGCPRCRASAATLAQWTRQYRNRNFEVIAILLPKKDRVYSDEELRSIAKNMGWNATIAVDQDWSVLKTLWAGSGPRYSVSVGLLVDRDGIVRAVHHGGYLSESDARGGVETTRFHAALDEVIADSYTSAEPTQH